ncbi:MAG: ester cyclase [Solirubrobacterales bacterium]
MAGDENRELVERFYREVVNERLLEVIDELLAEDFSHNGGERGRDGQRRVYEEFFAAFPDLQTEVVEIFSAGDRVAVHRRWTGTHRGDFQGVGPTGKGIDFESTAILTVCDGQITRYDGVLDLLRLMQQIGAAPPTSC